MLSGSWGGDGSKRRWEVPVPRVRLFYDRVKAAGRKAVFTVGE